MASVATVPGRTKGDRESVRRAILDAAMQLVSEVGADFTTQDLIKRADVALQTFDRHFGGKDQLLLALIETQIRGFAAQLGQAGAAIEDPVERLHFYVEQVLENVRPGPGGNPGFITSEHWRLHRLFPNEVAAATQAFADLIQRELEAGVASGALTVADPARSAWMINQLVMAVYHHYAYLPDDPALATLADDTWRFCLAAIGGGAAPSRGRSRRRR
jgi:AcrR family transcriptional regulator